MTCEERNINVQQLKSGCEDGAYITKLCGMSVVFGKVYKQIDTVRSRLHKLNVDFVDVMLSLRASNQYILSTTRKYYEDIRESNLLNLTMQVELR